jgi:hypothetical protein
MRRNGLILVAALSFAALAYFLLRNEFAATPDPSPAKPEARIPPQKAQPRPVIPIPDPVEPPPSDAAGPTAAEEPEQERIDLPPLAQSDAFVRERLESVILGIKPDVIH